MGKKKGRQHSGNAEKGSVEERMQKTTEEAFDKEGIEDEKAVVEQRGSEDEQEESVEDNYDHIEDEFEKYARDEDYADDYSDIEDEPAEYPEEYPEVRPANGSVNNVKFFITILVVGIIAFIAYFFISNSPDREVVTEAIGLIAEDFTLELGTEPYTDITHYFYGNEVVLQAGTLDFSNLLNEVGVFTIYASIDGDTYTFTITVVDTIGPVISYTPEVEVSVGEEVDSSLFFHGVEDYSRVLKVELSGEEYVIHYTPFDAYEFTLPTYTFQFPYEGDYIIMITAIDYFKNTTTAYVRVAVVSHEHDVFGIGDMEVEFGTRPNFLSGVTFGDEIVEILVDDSNVNYDEAGIYVVTFQITCVDERVSYRTITLTILELVEDIEDEEDEIAENERPEQERLQSAPERPTQRPPTQGQPSPPAQGNNNANQSGSGSGTPRPEPGVLDDTYVENDRTFSNRDFTSLEEVQEYATRRYAADFRILEYRIIHRDDEYVLEFILR